MFKKWKGDIESSSGAKAGFPIIADSGLEVSKAFDMLPAEAYLPDGRTPNDSATVRSVFIIGPDKKLKLSMTYPMTVGRNFAEVLRALDALQTSTGHGVATPANWTSGDKCMVTPNVTDEAGWRELDPGLKAPPPRFQRLIVKMKKQCFQLETLSSLKLCAPSTRQPTRSWEVGLRSRL